MTEGDVPGATWCLRAFADLPLPMRMRAAADVLEECNRYIHTDPNNDWTPSMLRNDADVWEREDAEKTGKKKAVNELASALYDAGWKKVRTDQAQALIDAGWTKVTGDE